jgi:hypothetical protein
MSGLSIKTQTPKIPNLVTPLKQKEGSSQQGPSLGGSRKLKITRKQTTNKLTYIQSKIKLKRVNIKAYLYARVSTVCRPMQRCTHMCGSYPDPVMSLLHAFPFLHSLHPGVGPFPLGSKPYHCGIHPLPRYNPNPPRSLQNLIYLYIYNARVRVNL